MNREVLFTDIAVIGFDARPILFRIILFVLVINLVVGLFVFLSAILKSFLKSADKPMGQTHFYPAKHYPTEKSDIFKILGIVKNKPITKWNELVLKDYLSRYSTEDLPDFGKWVQYTGETTQRICFLKLIGHFGQTTSAEVCVNLLDSPQSELCVEAIRTLGKLRSDEVEEKLFKTYFDRDWDCKYEILKAVSFISSGRALEFLKTVYLNSNQKLERKSALEAIYMYNAEGKYFFLAEKGKASRLEKQVFEHIENPKLNSRFVEDVQKFQMNTVQTINFHKKPKNIFAMDTS